MDENNALNKIIKKNYKEKKQTKNKYNNNQ